MMDRRMSAALDRWLTTPPDNDNDVPDDALHLPCGGEGCIGCGGSGIDPVKAAEYEQAARLEAEAAYDAAHEYTGEEW